MVGVYKIIQKLFEEQIALFRASFKRHHYISVGIAKKGRQLLHSLKEDEGRKAVVIEKDADHNNLSSVKKEGHTVIIGDAEEEDVLLSAGIKRASNLILFLENEQAVIEITDAVQQIYKKSKKDNLLKCYLHLRQPRLIDLVKNAGLDSRNEKVELHFFNQHKMVARQFFSQVLNDFQSIEIPLQDIRQIVLLGFGNFAQAILLQALRVFHLSGRNDLHIDVYTENAARDEKIFNEHYPKANKIFPINFYDFDGSFSALVDREKLQQLDQQTLFITAFDDEDSNLNYSLEILNLTSGHAFPVYVLNTDGAGLRSLIRRTTELALLHFFGNMEEIGTIEFITAERQDKLAQAIHDDYQKNISGVDSESKRYTSDWYTLSEDAKDANRAQADHIPYKLFLTNKAFTDQSSLQGLAFTKEEIEMLAIIEHNRWMAHRYLNGWDFGTLRNDQLKLHPSLVSWEDLSESEKQKDRETILRIPWLLNM